MGEDKSATAPALKASPPISKDGDAYLSLQPKPVVRPMPPLNNLPSRCLTRLLGVSLESFGCLLPVELLVSNETSEKEDWKDI